MHVRVDHDKCIGSGQCVRVAGQVFDQDIEDGRVIVLQDDPDASLDHEVELAAKLCPARAIVAPA